MLVYFHAETQPHRGQDFFNLVQRLAAEILRFQHLGFGLLHEFANGLNVCVLQAVVAAPPKLELFNGPVEVFVVNVGLAIIRGRAAGLDLFLEVDEDVHVVLQQLRRQTYRVSRRDGTVGPDLKCEFVVVGDLSQTCSFDGVITLAYRRVHGIDRNESDAEILVEVLVCGNVSAPALQAHFHVELAAFADRCDVNILIEYFDVTIRLDHSAGNNARLISSQINRFRGIARKLEWNLLQVEDDVRRILDHSGDRLEFVQHAFHLHRGNGCALNRTQQHATQGIAHGGAESALKRLSPEDAVLISEGGLVNCETFRFLKTFPKHVFLLRPFG